MIANPTETFRVLLVSKESAVLSMAESSSWKLETAGNGWDAMERLQSDEVPHLLVLDMPRGDGDSLQLLSWLRRLRPDLSVIVLCHADDAGRRKEAIRVGAKDVLVRPFDARQLAAFIERHLVFSMADAKVEMASEDIEPVGEDSFFLSVSPNMRNLRAQAELLAQSDVPVLILGEPGSGKGTVGRLIHKLSVHSGFKFLRVNCAEMPADLLEIELFGRESNGAGKANGKRSPGKLEIGQKGTILLDEITAMPRALQTKLLQVLEERSFVRSGHGAPPDVGVRILASSSEDVSRALTEKRLRADLYYRLSAFTVHVPPLRQRKEEINVLLRYSMHKLARYYGLAPREFSPSAVAACQAHSWPGNFKELETFVKRYLVAGDPELAREGWERESRHPQEYREQEYQEHEYREAAAGVAPVGNIEKEPALDVTPTSLKSLVQSVKSEAERNAITAALEKTGWNRKAAARLLGVSYRTVLYKIEMYKIEPYAMSASRAYSSPLAGSRAMGVGQTKGSGKAS